MWRSSIVVGVLDLQIRVPATPLHINDPGQVVRTQMCLCLPSSTNWYWYWHKLGAKQAHDMTYWSRVCGLAALAGVWLRAIETRDQRCPVGSYGSGKTLL